MDKSLLELVSQRYLKPTSGRLGDTGKAMLTFKAISFSKQALTTLKLRYRQPWNPKEGVVKSYKVAIEKSQEVIPQTPNPKEPTSEAEYKAGLQKLSMKEPQKTPWSEVW